MRHGRAEEVFRRGVLHVQTRREVVVHLGIKVSHQRGAEEGVIAIQQVAALPQRRVPQSDERAKDFPQRVADARGDEFQTLGHDAVHGVRRKLEVEDRERGIELLVVIFRGAVLLHAKLDMTPEELQVGLDDPLVAVRAAFAEDEGMGPTAPLAVRRGVTLGPRDAAINQRITAAEPHAPGPGELLEELTVRGAGRDGDDGGRG